MKKVIKNQIKKNKILNHHEKESELNEKVIYFLILNNMKNLLKKRSKNRIFCLNNFLIIIAIIAINILIILAKKSNI